MLDMKHLISTLLVVFGIITSAISQIGPATPPCDEESLISVQDNLALNKPTRQSSNYTDGRGSSLSVDGVVSNLSGQYSRTAYEHQPWIEIDLGVSYFIRGVKSWIPNSIYPTGLKDYYIFFSDIPFQDFTLNDLVSSSVVSHIYVEQPISNGQEIPAQYRSARYIRFQMAGTGIIAFEEIQVPGGPDPEDNPEICDNGIDDDKDCKIDCSDTDCSPYIWSVRKKNPTCPICNDGYIEIKAYGENLNYSIDDGATFHPCTEVAQTGWCGFKDLDEGDYKVKVTNGTCTSTWVNNPVQLRSPVGQPNGCCNNGDFESGSFDNWTGGVGEFIRLVAVKIKQTSNFRAKSENGGFFISQE